MNELLHIGEDQLLTGVNAFVWPFVRIGAMLLAAPLFGARTIPVRARVFLAVMLALMIAPMVETDAGADVLSPTGLFALGREVLIGVSLGFLLQMMFAAFAMAGEIVALSTGLAFATMVDPDRGTSVPLLGQYYIILATLLFVALDGHVALIALVVKSFEPLAAAEAGLSTNGIWALVSYGSQMFKSAVLVALPAAAALLLANVAMGMVARSAPQLNIFAVGFPMTLLLGILFLYLSMPALLPQLSNMTADVFERAGELFDAFAGTGRATP